MRPAAALPETSGRPGLTPRDATPRRDASGTLVAVPARPSRIVSLIPSVTELLFALGLDDRIAGVTIFCTRAPRPGGPDAEGRPREGSRPRPHPRPRPGPGRRQHGGEPARRGRGAPGGGRSGVGHVPADRRGGNRARPGARGADRLGGCRGGARGSLEAAHARIRRSCRGAAARPGLLPDLAGAVHDDQPGHLRPRHAPDLRGRQRLRRQPGSLPDGHSRGRASRGARGHPAAGRAVPVPGGAPGGFRAARRRAGRPDGPGPPRGRQAPQLVRPPDRRGARAPPGPPRPRAPRPAGEGERALARPPSARLEDELDLHGHASRQTLGGPEPHGWSGLPGPAWLPAARGCPPGAPGRDPRASESRRRPSGRRSAGDPASRRRRAPRPGHSRWRGAGPRPVRATGTAWPTRPW